MNMVRFKWIAVAAAAVIAVAAGLAVYMNSAPGSVRQGVLFEVPAGAGLSVVAAQLESRQLIRSSAFFRGVAALRGQSRSIKSGFYRFDGTEGSWEILSRIVEGRVHTVKVVIPEGLDNRHIARRLAKAGLVKEQDFMQAASDGRLLAKYGFTPRSTTEGFLFPDTYLFPWGVSAERLVEIMIENFKRRVGRDLIRRMDSSSLGFYRTLILASIVEREAVRAGERPMIAGVFVNRYRRGQKFESCATIQYILGEVRRKLLFSHLRIKSPYNTYQNSGFPPGPIANPGLASLRAAAEPSRHNYLYFVSKNDGTHIFSETVQQHNRAAQKYQWSN